MKRILPRAWSTDPFFRQIDELEGIPVINIHLWFDRKTLDSEPICVFLDFCSIASRLEAITSRWEGNCFFGWL